MLTKILFTIVVIAVVLLFAKTGQQRRPMVQKSDVATTSGRPWIKVLAISVISLMLAGSAVFIYLKWQFATEVLVVQVIDTRSGRSTEYRVPRGKLEDRAFQTRDGRYVRLAETERMEIGAGN